MEVGKDLLLLGAGVAATLFSRWAWDRATAPDKAAEAARKADERIREELQHYGRRVEDRYVLRAVCEQCKEDQKHRGEAAARELEAFRDELKALRAEMLSNFREVFRELRALVRGGGSGEAGQE